MNTQLFQSHSLRDITKEMPPNYDQRGFSMVEVLIGTFLLAVMGLALSNSLIYSIRSHKYVEIGNVAKNLAVSKTEELSGVRIDLLNDSYDSTENNVAVSGHQITFKRVTNVTVNADGSRTIDVTVSSGSNTLLSSASYSTTYAPWE